MDEQYRSEKYRWETFSSWTRFTSNTRRQLALAGFVAQGNECFCPQCQVKISSNDIDEDLDYASNYFRKLHRERISHLNQHCPFLLCQTGTNIADLQPSSPCEWEDAEYPEHRSYQTRLDSFHSWPYLSYQNTYVTPTHLAERGFFFTGFEDAVTCFYCGNTLKHWTSLLHLDNERIVQLEHARFFPCRFLQNSAGNIFIKTADNYHPVTEQERQLRNPIHITGHRTIRPESIDQCLSTFDNWPNESSIDPVELAEAGFYYLGHTLQVQCYVCDLRVDRGFFGLSPLAFHRQQRPECGFLQAKDSTKTGDVRCVEEKWRLQTFDDRSTEPSKSRKRLYQELAACGFYQPEKRQRIRCAYCAVVIEPNPDQSIMAQHRFLMKQSITTDCPMVRAQCATNQAIRDRPRFPEHPKYQAIYDRRQSFAAYAEKYQVSGSFIEERAYAGFFLENMKRMRCFQCGNALPIQSKRLQKDYPQYDTAKLHAHFYPTCEWIEEILGVKYVAQVLFDRKKPNHIERPFSVRTASTLSDASSFLSSNISIGHLNLFDLSDYAEDSDDEDWETIATPLNARFTALPSPLSSPAPSSESSSGLAASQPSNDNANKTESNHSISPLVSTSTHPFRDLALQSTASALSNSPTDLAPADYREYLSSEANRLETFYQQNRSEFARLSVEELAYAGFYLDVDGETVRCPWCDISLTEKRFSSILRRCPTIPGSPLNDHPWTAMRVHRHAVGKLMDSSHPWCTWVRRQRTEIYANRIKSESFMRYPEYYMHASLEKRLQSFQSSWNYPSGSHLSKELMAQAGFIHLGEDRVICFYCGNGLCEFQPRDCPFEEHASNHPRCDYILSQRGEEYVNAIVNSSELIPQAKQKIEIRENETIKKILFNATGLTPNKMRRFRVLRMESAPAQSSQSLVSSRDPPRSLSISSSHFEELCQFCCNQTGSYIYHPCRHWPMCELCINRLDENQRQKCVVCRSDSTISLK